MNAYALEALCEAEARAGWTRSRHTEKIRIEPPNGSSHPFNVPPLKRFHTTSRSRATVCSRTCAQ
jgi:hypothetical protein